MHVARGRVSHFSPQHNEPKRMFVVKNCYNYLALGVQVTRAPDTDLELQGKEKKYVDGGGRVDS